MIPSFLLKLIACPACKGELALKDGLECIRCNKTYVIKKGIPILLRKELADKDFTTDDPLIQRKRFEASHFSSISKSYAHSLKNVLDDRSPYLEKYRKFVKEMHLSDGKDQSLLNIGGIGLNFIKESNLSGSSVVMDIAEEWLASKLKEDNSPYAVAGDLEELPFQSLSFDKIVCVGVIHHVPRKKIALEEIERVLKPGGIALIIEPSKWSVALPYYLIKRIAFSLVGTKGLKNYLNYHGSPYESFISLGMILKSFIPKGYDIKVTKSTPFRFPFLGSKNGKYGQIYFKIINKMESSFLTDWFGSYLFVTLHKPSV